MMCCGLGVAEKVKMKISAAAPVALLDYLLNNARNTWLARCQDLASCPRVAGPPGPSRIREEENREKGRAERSDKQKDFQGIWCFL